MTLLKRATDVLGGIVGGWKPLVPPVGWRQYELITSYVDPDGLEFPVIRFRKTSGPLTDTIAQVQSRTTSLFIEKTWPMGGGLLRGSYPALGWYALDPATLALVAGPLTPVGNVALGNLSQETREKTPIIDHVVQWFEHTLPVGPYVMVLVSRDPSTEHPLLVSGHPVEIAVDCLTRKGEEYEAASATAVMASMGTMLQHQMAVTDPELTPQDIIDTLSEGYGFTVRRSVVSGKTEFVHWLQKVQTLPTVVINDSHLREEGGPTFDLEEATRITSVRVTGEVISVWQSGLAQRVEKTVSKGFIKRRLSAQKRQRLIAQAAYLDTEKPASRLIITSADVTFDYSTDGVTPDSDQYGEQEIEISLNGMPAVTDSVVGGAAPVNLEQWAEGRARMVFSPASRGRQMARIRVRRTVADLALLGEAVTLDVDFSPNAQLGQTPTSQRGGQRPFRVVENTPELSGPDLLLADEGTGVQYTEVPDISVALDTSAPGMWLVTVNNAAALTADGAQVEFQCKIFAPAATPDFTDPGFRYTVDDSSTWIAAQVVRMGPFPIGHQVHFRASAWLFDSAASDWSAWDGIGGGGVTGAISSLTAGATTSSSVAYTWTNTNTSALVRVQLKLDTETDYSLVVDLPAGSTAFNYTGLVAETDYDARFVLVQGGTEVGTALTDSFTTDLVANQTQLTVPSDPEVWGGSVRPSGANSPGTYGLQVDAVFGPPDMSIVFEQAVETAVGSGTPGAYTVVLTTPAVVGAATRYQSSAPNDGKLRWLRAYAVAASFDPSATTVALAVDPWPDEPETGTVAAPAPGTGILRLFGHRPDVIVAPPAYSDEQAQDAVGAMVVDTATIDVTYTDATPELKWDVIPGGIKLDDLGAPDDNTDLNASTSAHGLLKKLPGGTATFLRGDGTFATPSAGGGSADPLEYTRRWGMHAINEPFNAYYSTNMPVVAAAGGAGTNKADAQGLFIGAVTGATSGNAAGYNHFPLWTAFYRQWDTDFVIRWRTGDDLTSQRHWVGAASTSLDGSDDPAAHLAAFRYSTAASDTNWQACVKDGTTLQVADTGVAVATDTAHTFLIKMRSASVEFWIDGTLVHTHTANLPSATQPLGANVRITTLTNATREFRYSYMWFSHI